MPLILFASCCLSYFALQINPIEYSTTIHEQKCMETHESFLSEGKYYCLHFLFDE